MFALAPLIATVYPDVTKTSVPAYSIKQTNDSTNDIVSLPPWDDMMADPQILVGLMQQQGIQEIDTLEISGPLGGGSADHNMKGYIHWTDGTSTKVQIKGSRTGDMAPASYREALFYSRIAPTISDKVRVPATYLGAADLDASKGIQVTEFMTDYVAQDDMWDAAAAGTLEDIGIYDFDPDQAVKSWASALANFHASYWMDSSLDDEWWVKMNDLNVYEGHKYWALERAVVIHHWNNFIRDLDNGKIQSILSDNGRACIQAVLDNWTWENVMNEMHSPDYRWGLVHGDFHYGQLMYGKTQGDTAILDWEWTGYMATPAIDLGTILIAETPPFARLDAEAIALPAYWHSLIEAGVNPEEYSYDRMYEEYTTYGFAHVVARLLHFASYDKSDDHSYISTLESFLDQKKLTPSEMRLPVYGAPF